MQYLNKLENYFATINPNLLALIAFFVSLVVLFVIKNILLLRLQQLSKKTKTTYDDLLVDILKNVKPIFYVTVAAYFSLELITLSAPIQNYFNLFILAVLLYSIALALQIVIDFLTSESLKKKSLETEAKYDTSPIIVGSKIAKGLVWVTVVLLFLQNTGYNISTLVAGLGVGGIAIAFSLQNILEDVFSYFSIYFDKPFVVGDFLDVGNEQTGTVSHIGIKSTRLKTLQGEELIVSNKDITTSRIHNYKKMQERRISFSFGVVYETSGAKLEKIPKLVQQIIEKQENTRFDRVHFKSFSESSLDFEVVYFLELSDYSVYMDIQQNINLKLLEQFRQEKIKFAHPTRQVYLKND